MCIAPVKNPVAAVHAAQVGHIFRTLKSIIPSEGSTLRARFQGLLLLPSTNSAASPVACGFVDCLLFWVYTTTSTVR